MYRQVADDIRKKIAAGELPVGGRLPPYRALAEGYGVSIMTINKALAALVSEGTLYSRVGQGTFVASRPATESGQRRVLGFVLRNLSSPFFSLVARAAQERAAREGYQILFTASGHEKDLEEAQVERFRSLGVSGLIVASSSRPSELGGALRQLEGNGIPFVMVAYTEDEGIPFVGIDPKRGGFLATEHLIRHGYERIGLVTDRKSSRSREGELRREGYLAAMRHYGRRVDPALEWEYPRESGWDDYRAGQFIGEQLAGAAVRPEALFVYNDMGAIGLMDALLERGVRVPEDVALVGMDDIKQGERARVPLTTVRQPTREIGELAVDSLVRRLRGERVPARQLLEPEMVVRRSCGAELAARGASGERDETE